MSGSMFKLPISRRTGMVRREMGNLERIPELLTYPLGTEC